MYGLFVAAPLLAANLVAAAPHFALVQRQTNGTATTGAAPGTTSAAAGGSGGASITPGQYTQFNGDGSAAAGWPTQDQWADFETMFNNNKAVMSQSCANLQPATDNNSDAETQGIHDAILSVAKSSGVDERYILATVMQESNGCVRVHTTVSPDGTVRNPGLMQDHNGKGTCNDNNQIQSPCPNDEITQMITDGTEGTPEGDGLKQVVAASQQAGAKDAQVFYQASRRYNSGSVNPNGDLAEGGATPCYASDIANRLTGFVGTSKCTL